MDKDLITVIVPCYKVEKTVYSCLRSIEQQTYGYDNLEVILIDDASPDNVPGMLDAFKEKHPDNTIVVHLRENGGLSHARNVGMDIATGKYIMFVDSDDAVDATIVEKLHDKAVEYNCELVQCAYTYCDDMRNLEVVKGNGSRFVDLTDPSKRKSLIISTNKCPAWGKLYLREALEKNNIRFPEGKYYEDNPVILMCYLVFNSLYIIDETLYFYYINEEGITRSTYDPKKVRDFTNSLNWFLDELKKRDDYQILWDTYRYEIESFYLWLAFFCPMGMLLREARWYRNQILEKFPDILKSPYVTMLSDPTCREYLSYLSDDKKF